MHLREFVFEKVIIEVRYPTNYSFWDNSGSVLAKLTEQFPLLELRDAKISNVLVDWGAEDLTLNFSNQKADVAQDYPKSLDTFKNVSSVLCRALEAVLGVKSFERAGVRYIFTFPLKSAEEARDFFLKMGLVTISNDKLQTFLKGKIEEEQVVVRYEDENRGYTFRLAHTPREIAFKVPKPLVLNTEQFHKNAVFFDIDCYTKKSIESPAFLASDFIRLTYRTMEDNLLPLFGL